MTDHTLHIPVEFELSESVQLLAARTSPIVGVSATELATLTVLRLWSAWARERQEWRALRNAVPAAGEPDWTTEPIGLLLEKACGWTGGPGVLLARLVGAGILLVERREGITGLRLPAFEDHNEHLLPGFRTMQQKGGVVTGQRKRLQAAEGAVVQTQQLVLAQGIDLFGGKPGMTDDDAKAALSLVMRLDTAAGRPLRNPSEYRGEAELMRAALARTKRSTPTEIEAVLRYLMEHARNPAVPKDAPIVLRDFDALLRMALPPEVSR